MAKVETRSKPDTAREDGRSAPPPPPIPSNRFKLRLRILPVAITFCAVALAILLAWAMWNAYMGAPWTRDGTVRAYVVTMAPEVSGRIAKLPVVDNQFVHKGDLLMVIDPTNYRIAVSLAEAAVTQAQVNRRNAERQAKRRQALSNLAVSAEEQQTYTTQALTAEAQYQQALANLDQARVNLRRTEIRSPVNGWVTNLLAHRGDYATAGQKYISLVDAASFWVDGYFEETNIGLIHVGDPATIKLMSYSQILHGHVEGIARGINIPNAQPDQAGLPSVNPIFTWVRLAQRIPVHIHLDKVPHGVHLAVGMTATVQISPRPEPSRE